MIRFTCPSCRTVLQTSDGQGGVIVGCPNCKSQMKVPTQVAPPSASVVSTVSKATGQTQTGQTSGPTQSQPLEVRLRELLAKHGQVLCGDTRRCESLVRDICGDRTKEAHLLIQALKQQVPADLLGMQSGTAPLPTLRRLRKRLEDSVGLAEAAARWAVNAWALALGIITENELRSETISEAPPPESSIRSTGLSTPVGDGTVTLEELAVDPAAYDGQTIRVRGNYRTLYAGSGHFTMEQGDLTADVYYDQLPRDQKAMVLREKEAKRKVVLVEGTVECDGTPKITATNVSIEGMQPSPPQRSQDGTVTLEELAVNPVAYNGKRIRVRGSYRTLYAGSGHFTMEQGDLTADVYFSQLPQDQKAMVLREKAAKRRAVVVEGMVECDGTPKITATSVSIEGLQPSPPQRSRDGTVTLEELAVNPAAYDGRTIRVRGNYRTLYAGSGHFTLEHGDLSADVYYDQLPRDQKAIVLREKEAKKRAVLVEGVVECDGTPKITATSISIEGMQPSPPQRSRDGTVTLEELAVDPAAYDGQTIRVRGNYRTLYAGSGHFTMEQGDLTADVYYDQLPRDQKAMVLREKEAKRKVVLVEGTVECDGTPKIAARAVSFE